nr:hypothetical protein HK105_006796 [Polyrhizophydium stewartii]
MALKQKEIAQMNEANEFVEAALKTKASAKKRESFFPLFRSGASSPSGEPADESRRQSAANRATLPTTLAKKTASPAPPVLLTAHDLEINCIAIRRDGSMIATGSNDKKLILHDAKTCAQKAVLTGSLQAVMSVSFNSTGDFVIGTSNDNSAKIWSVATSRLKHTLTGHIGRVYSARFSDSNGVVTGSHDRTIKIWDLNKGYCIKTIFTLSSCNDLALLGGEGAVIASGHLDNNLRIWDARSGNIIREVTGIHFGQITSVEVSPRMNWTKSTFSPDGEYVTSGSADGAVVFWDVATGAVVQSLREHKAAVCGVVWNPLGGSAVYSASDRDRCIVQWGV